MKSRFALPALALAAIAALVALPLVAQETPAPAPAPGPQAHHGRHAGGPPVYDLAAEITVSGRVADVVPQSCACGGLHLKLATASGELEVGLGPAAFLGELGAQFAVGDELQITGAKPKNEAPADFLARSVKKGESTYELRDAAGAPRWAAQGAACPMHRQGAKVG